MITIFTIPKPFQGHLDIIQRNALRSWKLLNPSAEIILFGDDFGVAETAHEFGFRHIPEIARNEYGTPLVNEMFEKVQCLAVFERLCYINSDIILTKSIQSVCAKLPFSKFLVVGRRWNLDVKDAICFDLEGWENRLLDEVKEKGEAYTDAGIDYFIFPKGLLRDIPSFAIGRSVWDNWLLFKASLEGASLIDASNVFAVIHQNHSYLNVLMDPTKKGAWRGPEAEKNLRLAGDLDHCFSIRDAEWLLTESGPEKMPVSLARFARGFTIFLVKHEEYVYLKWLLKPILKLRLLTRYAVRFLRKALCQVKR